MSFPGDITSTLVPGRLEPTPCNLGFHPPAASSSTISRMYRFDLGRRSTNSTPIHLAPRKPAGLPRTRNDSSLTVKVSSKTLGRSKSGSGSSSSTSLHPFKLRSSIRAGHDFSVPRRWISAKPSHSKRGCFLSSFICEGQLTDTSSTRMRTTRTVSQSGTKVAFRRTHERCQQNHRRSLLNFSAPFGVAGFLREHFLPRRYFIKFLQARDAVLRGVTESPTEEWRRYLS